MNVSIRYGTIYYLKCAERVIYFSMNNYLILIFYHHTSDEFYFSSIAITLVLIGVFQSVLLQQDYT